MIIRAKKAARGSDSRDGMSAGAGNRVRVPKTIANENVGEQSAAQRVALETRSAVKLG